MTLDERRMGGAAGAVEENTPGCAGAISKKHKNNKPPSHCQGRQPCPEGSPEIARFFSPIRPVAAHTQLCHRNDPTMAITAPIDRSQQLQHLKRQTR